ncbi:MAG: hypothetical protein RIS21_749 [Planctomycetota bacterium]
MTPRSSDILDYAPPAWIRAHETFWACELSNLDRDMTAAEIGCGTGANLLRAAAFVGRFVGLESDADLRRRASDAVKGLRGLSVLELGATTLPLVNGSVDLLFSDLTRPGARPPDWLGDARRVLSDLGNITLLAFADGADAKTLRDDWTARAADAGFAPKWLEHGPDALVELLRNHGFDVWKEPSGDVFTVIRAAVEPN